MAEKKSGGALSPIRNLAANTRSRKLVVWTAVTGVMLGIPASPDVQCWAVGIAGAAYLLGQGVADLKK